MAESRQPLPRGVILLGWVSFFADVSGEMTYPLLPLFLVGTLGASASSLGWVEGVAQAVVALLAAWAGFRSDRMRRRTPYIRWGYGLPVLGKALLAVATVWPMVLVGRTIDRFGKGMRGSPRDALLADLVEPADRGRAFGLHRAMDTAGAFTGVLLAAGVIAIAGGGEDSGGHGSGWGFRVAFAVAAVLGLAALGLTFVIREPSSPKSSEAAPRARAGLAGLPRRYWVTAAILWIFALANSSDAFILLRAKDVGLAPWAVVLSYALFNLTYTLVSYPAGVLSDKIGRWRLILAGYAVYALCYAGFAVTGPRGLWPLMAAYGVYMALTDGIAKALLSDHLPKDLRGTGIGLFMMVSALLTLASSVIAGMLWDHVGHATPFWVGAGASALAVVLIAATRLISGERKTS